MRKAALVVGALVLTLLSSLLYAVNNGFIAYEQLPKSVRTYILLTRRTGMTAAPAARLAEARAAVERDPAKPYRWCDLAEALESAGEESSAEPCMRRAVDLGNSLPPILIRAVNFYFSRGEIEKGLEYGARVLALVHDYDSILFGTYRRFSVPIEQVLSGGLPRDARSYRAYFRDLVRWADPTAIELAWAELAASSFQDDLVASDHLQFLIARKMYDNAAATWAEYLGEKKDGYRETTYLFNGGFEEEPTGAPMDWNWRNTPGVEIDRVTGESWQGSRSLRLRFNGDRNVVLRQVSQVTSLPAGRFRFRASVKSDGVGTDKGLYFQIFDRDSPSGLNVKTEAIRGTADWRAIETEFTLRESGRLLEVRVCRDESLRIDSKIRGTVWIDGLRLERR